MAEAPVAEAEIPASTSSEESGNTSTAEESSKGLSFAFLTLCLMTKLFNGKHLSLVQKMQWAYHQL